MLGGIVTGLGHHGKLTVESFDLPLDLRLNELDLDLVDLLERIDLLTVVVILIPDVGRVLGDRFLLGRGLLGVVGLGGVLEQLGLDLLVGLPTIDLDNRLDHVRSVGQIPVRIGNLEIDGLAENRPLESLLESPVGDRNHTIPDDADPAKNRLIGLLVGCVRIGVCHRNGVIALNLQPSVSLPGTSQPGRNAAEGNPYVAAHREAIDRLAVTTGDGHCHLDRLAGFQGRQIGIVDPDKEPLARFHLRDLIVLTGHVRSDLFQGRDRPAVMTQLEMAQADVVVSLVDLGTDRKLLDHIPHHAETFAEISSLVKADTDLECRLGPLVLVTIVLGSGRLEVGSSLVVSPVPFEKEASESHVGLEPQTTPGIPLYHTLPDLDGLLQLLRLEPGVTRLDQLLGRAVLDQGASQAALLLGLSRRLGRILRRGLSDNQGQQKTERNTDSQ